MSAAADGRIVVKVAEASERAGPSIRPDSENPIVISLSAENMNGELRRAVVAEDVPKGSAFALIADEGEAIGGGDSAPTPLSYFAASIAFCFMSQMSQYAKARKLELRGVRIEQTLRFSIAGSRLDDTREVGCVGLETDVEIESPELEEEDARKLVSHAERTCFVLQSLLNPVPIATQASLNGRALALDSEG